MTDDSVTEDAPVTFNVKSSNDAKYTVTMAASATVADLKEKLSSKDYADLPVERQRLIYSGRVLKDPDTLGSYKIKEGNTVHLVKGAASSQRQNPANQGTPAASAMPTNLSAGTGNNPLAGLTGARYAGFAQLPNQDMFGPDGGMGPPPDPEDMIRMLQNPQFASTLNEALANPQLIDTMIQQNPLLREMGPQVRQMMQTPEFRRMMTDPEQLRSMMQMQRMFGGGSMGLGGGNPAFPAPGVTDTTPGAQSNTPSQGTQQQRQQPPANPFASAFGQQGQGQANPFAALFNPAMFGNTPAQSPPVASAGQGTPTGQDAPSTGQQQNTAATGTTQPQNTFPFGNPGSNPILQNPQLLSQLLQAMNPGTQNQSQNPSTGGQAQNPQDPNANPFAALLGNNPWLNPMLGGMGAPPPQNPPDNRPPEERYAEQLRQLNDMGFYEFERNVEALRRTGGSVQGAVEYLLTH